jgi:hypothetical protein
MFKVSGKIVFKGKGEEGRGRKGTVMSALRFIPVLNQVVGRREE